MHHPGVEVTGDGNTVWINGRDGGCIGRFSRWGIDVHHEPTVQMAKGTQCLACTHVSDWERFKALMVEHFGVTVGDYLRPRFLDQA